MQPPAQLSSLNLVFGQLISVALTLVGIVALAMLVVGGYQFLMAGGDKEGAAKARNTITYAIIGLVLAASAWTILTLFGSFFGISFQVFNICFPGQAC